MAAGDGDAVPGGRSGYAMALLQSGKVLIAGGHDSAGTVLSTAELFDPSTGGFTLTANPMSIARNNFSATALGNGTVLLAGGLNSQGVTASAELYDPVGNTFTTLSSMMSVARAGQRATLLSDGTVLLSGGFGPDGASLTTCDYFDPATNSFATGPSMSTPRNRHTATRLNNGDVLMAGGDNDLKPLAGAELYVPNGHESGSFVPLSAQMTTSRTGAAASLMPNGDVLISGGATVSGGRASNLATADVYDPTTQQFSAAANSMSSPRFLGTSTLLADHTVLVAGGFAGGASIFSLATNAVDIFNPADNSFTAAAPLLIGRGNTRRFEARNVQTPLPFWCRITNGSSTFGGIGNGVRLTPSETGPLCQRRRRRRRRLPAIEIWTSSSTAGPSLICAGRISPTTVPR